MKKGSRRLAVILALCLVFTSMVTTPAAAAAKAKKPGKVEITSIFKYAPTKSQLTWDKVPNAKKYEVYASENGKKFKKVGTTKKLFFQHKKLKKNKTYRYKVRAVNGNKKGKFSAVKYIPRTIQEYMTNNPAEAATAQQASPESADKMYSQIVFVNNDIIYMIDATNDINAAVINGFTQQDWINDRTEKLNNSVYSIANSCRVIESDTYLSGLRIVFNYTYSGVVVLSRTFNSYGAL
ncbi:MAG: hypothetical protein IKE85_10055 [Mogibacterium sp.]|nr:hypothetical protein [Mogibacterium sp.]